MRVAVIGLGVVGRAQVRMLEGEHEVTGYDAADHVPYPSVAIAGCDFAIIATGTPAGPDGTSDLSALYAALGQLPPGVPALIRSTIPPGTTDAVNRAGWLAAHWPEFLHERDGGAWRESLDVPFAILGGPPEALAFFGPRVREIRGATRNAGPRPYVHECDGLTAELAKYAANIHWAARVTLVNELAAIAAAHGADWEQVRRGWTLDYRVGAAYTRMEGFPPGYGGACWPKDIAALTASASAAGYKARFLEDIAAANARFREGCPVASPDREET